MADGESRWITVAMGTGLIALTFGGVAQGLFVQKAIFSSSSCADNKLPSVFGLAQAEWWGVDGEDQMPRNCQSQQRSPHQPWAYGIEELSSAGVDTYSYRTCGCRDAGCLDCDPDCTKVTIGRSNSTCIDDRTSRYLRSQEFSVAISPPSKPTSGNAGRFDEGVLLDGCINPGNGTKRFSWHPFRCVSLTGAGYDMPQYQMTNASKYIQPDGMPGVRVTWNLEDYYKPLPDFTCGTPSDKETHVELNSYNCAYDASYDGSSKVKWAGGL